MMPVRQVLLTAVLFAGSAPALAIECAHATARIDLAVCHSPDLTRLDAQLNDLYRALRPQIAASARPVLLAQQRRWLALRDTACATADPACLTAQYQARIDELTALTASAHTFGGPTDDSLTDMTPIIVRGRWKATALDDPSADAKPASADLQSSLSAAKLPALGGFLDTAPGKVCVLTTCTDIGWTRSKLAQTDNAIVVGDELKLPQTTPVLTGTTDIRHGYYMLIPRPDKTVLAVFSLCRPNNADCRQAAEVLTPVSPDAAVSPRP